MWAWCLWWRPVASASRALSTHRTSRASRSRNRRTYAPADGDGGGNGRRLPLVARVARANSGPEVTALLLDAKRHAADITPLDWLAALHRYLQLRARPVEVGNPGLRMLATELTTAVQAPPASRDHAATAPALPPTLLADTLTLAGRAEPLLQRPVLLDAMCTALVPAVAHTDGLPLSAAPELARSVARWAAATPTAPHTRGGGPPALLQALWDRCHVLPPVHGTAAVLQAAVQTGVAPSPASVVPLCDALHHDLTAALGVPRRRVVTSRLRLQRSAAARVRCLQPQDEAPTLTAADTATALHAVGLSVACWGGVAPAAAARAATRAVTAAAAYLPQAPSTRLPVLPLEGGVHAVMGMALTHVHADRGRSTRRRVPGAWLLALECTSQQLPDQLLHEAASVGRGVAGARRHSVRELMQWPTAPLDGWAQSAPARRRLAAAVRDTLWAHASLKWHCDATLRACCHTVAEFPWLFTVPQLVDVCAALSSLGCHGVDAAQAAVAAVRHHLTAACHDGHSPLPANGRGRVRRLLQQW